MMRESAPSLSLLRQQLAAIERAHGSAGGRAVSCAPLGHDAIDAALGGGLARGRLHEIFAAEPEDAASAAAFTAMLSRRIDGPLLWLRQDRGERDGALFAPGLSAIGIDPGRVLLAALHDPRALLRAAGDGLRCAALGSVVIELWQRTPMLDLTASRRLALAAEDSGVTALLLRVDAAPAPSAGWTRWSVASAPSVPLPAQSPGHPAFDIVLARQRGGSASGAMWRVEWDHDGARFREPGAGTPPHPLPVLPHPADRPAAADAPRRAAA
jgi:protein ImuA